METLLRFIPLMKGVSSGQWVFDKAQKKSQQMPYVRYNKIVVDFMKAVYEFCDGHPEYGLNQYLTVLKEKGIGAFNAIDIEIQDTRTVLSMLVCCVRQERFCDGYLKRSIESGVILRCLERLAVLHSEGKIDP